MRYLAVNKSNHQEFLKYCRVPIKETLQQYGFCFEHTPKGVFYEIHNESKFLIYLLKFNIY